MWQVRAARELGKHVDRQPVRSLRQVPVVRPLRRAVMVCSGSQVNGVGGSQPDARSRVGGLQEHGLWQRQVHQTAKTDDNCRHRGQQRGARTHRAARDRDVRQQRADRHRPSGAYAHAGHAVCRAEEACAIALLCDGRIE